ncbi:hypothetical protein [Methylomonas koyamae]|nr:hypothetical protein [Methylomonas koyamae]
MAVSRNRQGRWFLQIHADCDQRTGTLLDLQQFGWSTLLLRGRA